MFSSGAHSRRVWCTVLQPHCNSRSSWCHPPTYPSILTVTSLTLQSSAVPAAHRYSGNFNFVISISVSISANAGRTDHRVVGCGVLCTSPTGTPGPVRIPATRRHIPTVTSYNSAPRSLASKTATRGAAEPGVPVVYCAPAPLQLQVLLVPPADISQ
jgi:hypothetical protein